MPSLVTERTESVKAGIVGAGTFAISELVFFLAKEIAINTFSAYNLTPVFLNGELLLQLAIGAVSGFLFGVTYRYIIRDDRNFHLNDGAVLAFGLVRGLALVENNLVLSELGYLIFLIVQSIICFAIARSILDLAISSKFIKPFV
ncbi:hypothetical protein I4641_10210 [Waterburya agarophytonicola K14]|uniref:Uncharacterized protein n=1 Tax=Waterburya agarophytonicola KI4 TaxID=2874699 RepID=A0A964BPT2_9CYAN|nr:hypothetical protein [Waterburya agarophytonicola KI4]